MSKEEVYISVDTEFESSNIINGNILQLGFCVFRIPLNLDYNLNLKSVLNCNLGSNDPWLIDQKSFCFQDQGKMEDESCMEFWAKFPEIYKRIQDEALPIAEQFLKMQVWLNEIHDKYKVVNFVSDYVSVDYAWFKNLYLVYCDTSKDNFFLSWKPICTSNIRKVLIDFGFDKEELTKKCEDIKYPHTHYAMDDALETAYEYIVLSYIIKCTREEMIGIHFFP